jgi:exosortase/archaeosortase family protein
VLEDNVLNARIGRTVPLGTARTDAHARTAPQRRISTRLSIGMTAAMTAAMAAPAVLRFLPLAMLLAALWPHWGWMAWRMTDGSDEPWGVVALVTVLLLLVQARAQLRPPPGRTLAIAAVITVAAACATALVPPIFAAALAVLAVGLLFSGQLPQRSAAPLLTLLLLTLPIIATLQFYLGFPLRAATAWLAAPTLGLLGIDVTATGAALQYGTGTVLVDAPCAGIGMLWLGSYCAALFSWWQDADARRTLVNGLVTAGLVFLANLLRNVVLFFPESGLVAWPAWSHDAVGVLAFALAIAPSIAFAQSRAQPSPAVVETPSGCGAAISSAAHLFFVGACLLAAVVPALARVSSVSTTGAPDASADPVLRHVEWPTHFRDRPLTQLALTPLELRFASRFPGAIARFTDGRQIVIARSVTAPTRMLHPATDCFRGAGFAITAARAAVDTDGVRWNCFEVRRGNERARVCERIEDATGRSWTDVSAWYWAALKSSGPWRAWTVATPLGADG